jgi:DNA polymerase III subunit beta
MKFVCTQHDLNINLALVSRAVSTRPTHPVLANIKLEATSNPDLIRLTGFDLSLGIQTSLMAQVDEEGTLTLPAKLLSDIVAKLPSGEITFDDEAGDNYISFRSLSGAGIEC